jgi:acetate kinase
MPDRSNLIAVFNAGSSSLKFTIYQGESRQFQGLIDRLESSNANPAHAVIRGSDGATLFDGPAPATNHEQALDWLLKWFAQQPVRIQPAAVGHRVVHGGDEFTAPARVTPEVVKRLDALTPLAPLHQPHSLAPIRFFLRRLPDLPQIVCFDTAFHATQSRIERMYALPRDYFDKGIKRYGFHGLSYEFIAGRLAEIDERAAKGRTIVCHLGNGASLCALRSGKSVATTMGFTPLDGVPMGTRCGTISPDVLLYFLRQEKWNAEQFSDLLYHRSGLKGISGVSADMRDLLANQAASAAEAVEYFCYRIAREIGSLAAALGGLDAIVFTAGIGEHAPPVRARVIELCRWLGAEIDSGANSGNRTALHASSSSIRVFVISTDEELMILRHTEQLLGR